VSFFKTANKGGDAKGGMAGNLDNRGGIYKTSKNMRLNGNSPLLFYCSWKKNSYFLDGLVKRF